MYKIPAGGGGFQVYNPSPPKYPSRGERCITRDDAQNLSWRGGGVRIHSQPPTPLLDMPYGQTHGARSRLPPGQIVSRTTLKTILTTPTPHAMGSASFKSRDFYRDDGIRTQKCGNEPPPFVPYEPFLLWVRVVFTLVARPCEFSIRAILSL